MTPSMKNSQRPWRNFMETRKLLVENEGLFILDKGLSLPMTEGALVISFNSETSPIFCCLQKQSRTNQRTVTVLYLWPSHSNEWKMNISSLSSQNRLNGDNTVPLGGCSGCRFVRRQPLTTSEVFLCHRVTDRLVSASAWEIFREGTSLSVSFPSHKSVSCLSFNCLQIDWKRWFCRRTQRLFTVARSPYSDNTNISKETNTRKNSKFQQPLYETKSLKRNTVWLLSGESIKETTICCSLHRPV